jgi:tetratricopeptide (TPR) repeat protein
LLQSTLLQPSASGANLPELERLAQALGRDEDRLALLDRLTTPEFGLAQRKENVRKRAQICEEALAEPARAFGERRRLLELDPSDWSPLVDLERLADKHQLHAELDACYAQLWDQTTSDKDRLDLAARRERLARSGRRDDKRAFDYLVAQFRLDTTDPELLRKLTEDAERLEGWPLLLPLLDADQLAAAGQTEDEATVLSLTAALYQEKVGDLNRAFDLYALAFSLSPNSNEILATLETLAQQTKRQEQLIETLRRGAARSTDPQTTLILLKRAVALYDRGQADDPESAIDIHRRILTIKADDQASLETVIGWHRSRGEWRDLRDRLQQWNRCAAQGADRVPRLLEIAAISEQHLRDSEAALEAYGEVLEHAPQNEMAITGLEGLVLSITEPSLRLRWLNMELKNADEQRVIALRLEAAQIQQEDLGDLSGAIRTLRQVVDEYGADGPGFEPLARLIEEKKDWLELVLLWQRRAADSKELTVQIDALDRALALAHQHLGEQESELLEELYRRVLELRPGDRDAALRIGRLLRQAGRDEELADLLDQRAKGTSDTLVRRAALYDSARIRALKLGQQAEAEARWQLILEQDPNEEEAMLALARSARDRSDVPAYVELRAKQAQVVSPTEGALIFCHLAEVCDETPSLVEQMVPYYRQARGLDPDNVPAMEALKGIGRRLKSLRPAAALLPLDGERALELFERAKRLKALGDGSLATNVTQAIEWYRRATTLVPDDPTSWSCLAEALAKDGDLAGCYRARRGWLQATRLVVAPAPELLQEEADRCYLLASDALRAGDTDGHQRLIRQVHELMPHHAPAALAMAGALLQRGNVDEANSLLHDVLTAHDHELPVEQRATALYHRGSTLRMQGKADKAEADFRDALRLAPLHAPCLRALGQLLAEAGRAPAALEHLIRALTIVDLPEQRGQLYYQIGRLWEDQLGAAAEAGACYEMALAEGADDRDLKVRGLRHFQREGRLDESLQLIEGLLPNSHDPDELATLWLVKGEIAALQEDEQAAAIEAFDMALSYDPGLRDAREGLIRVLERREDWGQLLQVLEATSDAGMPEEQAAALCRMAKVSSEQLYDPDRAEQYLRRSVDAFPTREALELLEQFYTGPEQRQARREILGHLVRFGPPYFARATELGLLLLDEQPEWAWCVLSPLLGVSQIPAETKSVVQDMRKNYERPLPRYLADRSVFYDDKAVLPLIELLAQVDASLRPYQRQNLESLGEGAEAIRISASTALGKTLKALTERTGLDEISMYRAQSLPESHVVLSNPSGPQVVVRTDVVQQLVHAEIGYLVGFAIHLCLPGCRTLMAIQEPWRESLFSGLWHLLGFAPSGKDRDLELAQALNQTLAGHELDDWRARLADLAQQNPSALGQRTIDAVNCAARRAGLLAGADLRQIFRVLARQEDKIERPKVVSRLEDLDGYVVGNPVLADLVAFAAAPGFGKLLATATTCDAA